MFQISGIRNCTARRHWAVRITPPSTKFRILPHKGLNNRAGNSHQPTRRREGQRKCFKSAVQVQRFLSIHDRIANLFHLQRDHRPVAEYRGARTQAFQVWAEVAGAPLAV